MKWPWSKKSVEPTGRKDVMLPDSFINFLFDNGHNDLADTLSIDLYSNVGPLATGINKIADAFAGLVPIVWDNKAEKFINDHPVLELLEHPNADQTKTEFLKRMAAFFLITGDSFILGTGQVNKPPLEIWSRSPATVNILQDQNGFPGKMDITTSTGAFSFARNDVDGRWRFYEGNLRELWHIKTFNPNAEALRGQSLLTPVFQDIEQFRFSSTHNLSLLKRGARPSGVFLAPEGLTDDQYTRLKEQVDRFYTGANNTGRPLLVEGGGEKGIDYKDMMQSARDMDFLKLKENVTVTIYNHLGIPLPLVQHNAQTFDNMAAAKLQLYQDTVLPFADRQFRELTLFLMPRYKGSENQIITYDRSKIEALDLAIGESLTLRSKLGIHTINELRTLDNFERLPEGGDDVLRPANELPVARDGFTADQSDKPTRKKFFELMEGKGLAQEELEVLANKHGLV